MNIIKNRYWYFFISLVIIIPGLFFMGLHWAQHPDVGPIPLGIDFRGGSLFEVQFEGARPSVDQITDMYAQFSSETELLADPVIQPLGEDAYSIRSKKMEEETKTKMVAEMEASFGKVTVLNFTSISASVGAEVAKAASIAILFAAAAILFYIWWAFRGVDHPIRYGTAAIIAMLHDVLVVLGVETMLGFFLGWEADALFLTALLTVIGFSVHDTIVVFDRVRENSRIFRRLEYEALVNHSIVQTLDRSITTQLTVMFTLTALVLFGGDSIRHFVIILLVGIFSGTYSSIFNAAPILVVWENQEWKTWFKKKDELAPLS
ncbi:MAG: protein translocase subunit SecF [Chloroflexi bacterium]|nr:protein translocase subunit SecF [Chloroflexota bacterium]